MRRSLIVHGIAHGSERVPGLRALPVVKLLAIGELLLLAREHVLRLDPYERRRLVELVRTGHGRRRNLTPEQREELTILVEKAAPRVFLGQAVSRFSPVPLPRRIVYGRSGGPRRG